jgi:hypothetical protein
MATGFLKNHQEKKTMQKNEKLTSGQKIALGTFLSSYDGYCSFEKLLSAIHAEDFEVITIWEQVECMNATILAETIAILSVNIDALSEHP